MTLPDEAGRLRVIAGEYQGSRGPARTFTPINVWDLRLHQGGATLLTLPKGHTAGLVVLRGTVLVNDSEIVREAQLVLLDRTGGEVVLEANSDASVLVLSRQPIDEPVVMHGPFVMNTVDEIPPGDGGLPERAVRARSELMPERHSQGRCVPGPGSGSCHSDYSLKEATAITH